MRDTFEYSGDYEWALWRKGVLCAECETWDGTETEAVGVKYAVYGQLDASDLGEIHVTPVCEEHADSNVLRFPDEDTTSVAMTPVATTSFEGRSLSAMMASEPKEDD